jgi:tetratricopeptide (TPR) repeat protein
LLADAAARFLEFARADAAAPLTLDALRQAANLYAEQAMEMLAAADQLPDAADSAARSAAREQFAQAAAAASQLDSLCAEQLAALPKPVVIQVDPEAKAVRDRLRARQAEARFLLALISFEQSRTYAAKSNEENDALDAAWEKFGELAEEYRDTKVGATSRFYQGRCAQKQGDFAKALGCYEDLVELPPPDPDFRRLAARAHRHIAECLLATGKIDDAIRGCEDWLASSGPAEREQPEWLEVAYRLAAAYQAQMEKMEKSELGPADARRKQTEIRNLLRDVASHPNEFQRQARLELATFVERSTAGAHFKTFADAFAAGRTALEVMNSSLLAARLARKNNPEAVSELEGEAADGKQQALVAFEQTLELADAQTPRAEFNAARYYLSWLYWDSGRMQEAAVLGEFLATRFPEDEFASAAAQVALNAWERLYEESRAAGPGTDVADRSFASGKLAQLAQLVASRWPNAPEGASAVNILIHHALSENRIDQAEELLDRLPAASRGSAELSLGAALWTQYLQATAGGDAEFGDAAANLREKAGALLESGFAAYRDVGEPTTSGAVGSLYLVQWLLARGDWRRALEVLEDDAVGPLTLVLAEAEEASRPEFVLETFKAALRCFLSAQPPRREDAQEMMEALEEWAAQQGGATAAEQLTRVYIGLGIQLQRQVKELTAAGQGASAEQVAAAFGDILDRVAARPNAGDWSLRNWIAQTNLQIGQGLGGEEAKPYLDRARAAYEAALADAERGAAGAPDANTILAIRKRLGDCFVALGQYQDGVDQYAALLREKPTMLDVQKAAAQAYQTWGVAEKRQVVLDRAIRGALPQRDGKNLIWGWLRLASAADGARRRAAETAEGNSAAAAKAARFDDLFFEAHFNVAKVRYLGASFAAAGSRRQYLQAAQRNVEALKKLYPDLGGPKWKAAFETLLSQINQELEK